MPAVVRAVPNPRNSAFLRDVFVQRCCSCREGASLRDFHHFFVESRVLICALPLFTLIVLILRILCPLLNTALHMFRTFVDAEALTFADFVCAGRIERIRTVLRDAAGPVRFESFLCFLHLLDLGRHPPSLTLNAHEANE